LKVSKLLNQSDSSLSRPSTKPKPKVKPKASNIPRPKLKLSLPLQLKSYDDADKNSLIYL
jgi:hypothetical protein